MFFFNVSVGGLNLIVRLKRCCDAWFIPRAVCFLIISEILKQPTRPVHNFSGMSLTSLTFPRKKTAAMSKSLCNFSFVVALFCCKINSQNSSTFVVFFAFINFYFFVVGLHIVRNRQKKKTLCRLGISIARD